MDFDLTQGLRDMSRTAPLGPLPAENVLRRVRRGRAIRTTAVGLASAAVIVAAAATVQAAPWDAAPVPPATPQPSEPTPEPSEPTPEPPPPPLPAEERSIVGLTITGDLVVIDPATGETRTVYQGLTVPANDRTTTSLSVSPDRTVAYVSHVPGFDPDQFLVLETDRVEILAISLVDGTAVKVADGLLASVSPDGTTLAFVPPPGWPAPGLTMLDLETGISRHITDTVASFGPPSQVVWSPDSSRVYLTKVAAEMSALFVLPASAESLEEAVQFGDCRDAGLPVFLEDGTMVMSCVDHEKHECLHCEPEARDFFRMDPATGAVLQPYPTLPPDWSGIMVAGPVEDIAVLTEPEGGWEHPDPLAFDLVVRHGEGDAARLASDLVAIAW